MGRTKATLRVPEDGPTMLDRVLLTVRACCDQVVLVGNERSHVPDDVAGIEYLKDAGGGPVTGLIAALQACEHSRVLLAGCDMPFLSAVMVRLVIEHSFEVGRGVVPVAGRDGGTEKLQPLHGVYLQNQLEQVERAFKDGAHSLTDIVERLDLVRLRVDASMTGEEAMWSFFNVNTPEDLTVARRHAVDEP